METTTPSTKYVLIAEDDESNFKFLEIIITMAGFKVLWAMDGEKAVQLCQNNDVSLIFMDMRMPIMDGAEATKRIRYFNSMVPIVAQTAFALTGDEASMIGAGFSKFITKPISRKTILSILDEYIRA